MIVLDAEFTGLNPQQHSLISIGAIEFENPSNQFYVECRPWEGADYMEEAMEVNGFTWEEVNALPKSLEEGLKEFEKWMAGVGEHTLAGQNIAHSDLTFLETSYERYDMNHIFAHRSIDTHTLAYMHLVKRGETPPVEKGRSAMGSTFIQNYVGIPEEPKPHNALNGAKVAAEAISRLLYGKNLLPEFAENPVPEYLK